MSKYKKHRIVLVPTKNETNLSIVGGSLTYTNAFKCIVGQLQHLHIISDEPIEEGWTGWVYMFDTSGSSVFKYHHHHDNKNIYFENVKKIIASTDRTLGLPSIDADTTVDYVIRYNKKRPVQYVNVVYDVKEGGYWARDEDDTYGCFRCGKDNLDLSDVCDCEPFDELRITYNFIMVEKINTMSLDLDEVEDLIRRAVGESHDWSSKNNDIHSIGIIEKHFLNDWLKENLI